MSRARWSQESHPTARPTCRDCARGSRLLPQITANASDPASLGQRLDARLCVSSDYSAASLEQLLDGAAADVACRASDQSDFVLEISAPLMCHGDPVKRQEPPSETM
jgi:hypothetical protein